MRGHTANIVFSSILAAVVLAVGVWAWSALPYRERDFGLSSPAAESLRVFFYNKSVFQDPVPGCWYDGGDYVVVVSRNVKTFFYLSLAYAATKDPAVKRDIGSVLADQKTCIDGMLAKKYKQFGDQDSHGINLPPFLHGLFYPRNIYSFQPDEGKDAYLLYGLALRNADFAEEAGRWEAIAQTAKREMASEHCCEEGPLKISETEFEALQRLSNGDVKQAMPHWGLSLANLAFLESGRADAQRAYLNDLRRMWEETGPERFQYLGGNYDMAGTIAFERMFAKKTGDRSFKALSDSLFKYLKGENAYGVDFTDDRRIYHPCAFFGNCRLTDTLMNGIDETRAFDANRKDVWRLTEIQLVGQAEYVLAMTLYRD